MRLKHRTTAMALALRTLGRLAAQSGQIVARLQAEDAEDRTHDEAPEEVDRSNIGSRMRSKKKPASRPMRVCV